MACKWEMIKVSDIAAPMRNAVVGGPFGSNLVSRDYVEAGVPVIRGQNMYERWVGGEFAFVTREKASSLSANLARSGDIVFTQRGTLGQVSLVPSKPFDAYLISQSQMKLTVNRSKADPLFFYYVFRSPEQQAKIIANAIQVGVPHTNLGILRNTYVPLPPLSKQHAIARILGALDDKIELTKCNNETLEAIARAIFKSWFTDFDPVYAKANGEAPESICHRLGLTPRLLALFPERFQNSELGKIPSGWEVSTLGDLCDRIAMGPFGSDIKTSNFVTQGVPVIRGGNLTNGFNENNFVFLTEGKADELRSANARGGDIVITHRGTLGQVGLIPSRSQYPRYVVSQSQMVLTANKERTTPRFVYEFLRSPRGQQALLANISQVGVPAIARPTTSLKGISLVSPSLQLLHAYDSVVDPLFERVYWTIQESNTLVSVRDTLLPKLISGEIPVPS